MTDGSESHDVFLAALRCCKAQRYTIISIAARTRVCTLTRRPNKVNETTPNAESAFAMYSIAVTTNPIQTGRYLKIGTPSRHVGLVDLLDGLSGVNGSGCALESLSSWWGLSARE